MRLVEAFLETIPEVILLLAYLVVSIYNSESLGITDDLNSDYGIFFFEANFAFSLIIVLSAIINSTNFLKWQQLGTTEKVIIGLSYFLQIISRIIPISCILFLVIVKEITCLYPAIFHFAATALQWILHFSICLNTVPAFY